MKRFLPRLRRLIVSRLFPTACAVGCILSPLRGYGAMSLGPRPIAASSSSFHVSVLYTWSAILAIVFASVIGDVLLARAMKQVGDVGALWRRVGLVAVIGLLFALSWGDVSLVAPAAASLTFIGNAVAAKIFLHEKVDRRRWIAASLVAAGVALLAG